MSSRIEKRLPSEKSRKKRVIVTIIGILLGTVLVAWAVADCVTDSFDYHDSPKQAMELLSHKKINILVLGIDQRRNDIGRSNVTSVVTIDTGTKDVSMLWVPRDSRVKITGHGWNKIGHAYAYDGPNLSRKTVEDLLDISIDYYVQSTWPDLAKSLML